MKKFRYMALAAALSLSMCTLPMLVHGDEKLYDPENDPLVSLSYIDEVVKPEYEAKIKELSDIITELTDTVIALDEKLAAANEKIAAISGENPEVTENASSLYEVVRLDKGAKLLAKSPCEIILRSGTAIAVSMIENGLNNITDGSELLNAAEIPLYNCLLVPRGDDGRGIQITSIEAYVMVRGDYEVVE